MQSLWPAACRHSAPLPCWGLRGLALEILPPPLQFVETYDCTGDNKIFLVSKQNGGRGLQQGAADLSAMHAGPGPNACSPHTAV